MRNIIDNPGSNSAPMVEIRSGIPEDLFMAEQACIDAAHVLLDGRATKKQRVDMLDREEEYRQVLKKRSEEVADISYTISQDETATRGDIVDYIIESNTRIISNAAYKHYTTSKIERTRHWFEQTRLRRMLGSTVVGLASTGVVSGAISTLDQIHAFDRISAPGSGIAGIAIGALIFRYLKPVDLVKKAIELPSNHISRNAKRGINKHPLDLVTEVRRQEKEDFRRIQDKEISKKTSIQRIAKEQFLAHVNDSLVSSIFRNKLEIDQQRKYVVDIAVDHTVDWMLAFYGLQPRNGNENNKDRIEITDLFKIQRPIQLTLSRADQ